MDTPERDVGAEKRAGLRTWLAWMFGTPAIISAIGPLHFPGFTIAELMVTESTIDLYGICEGGRLTLEIGECRLAVLYVLWLAAESYLSFLIPLLGVAVVLSGLAASVRWLLRRRWSS